MKNRNVFFVITILVVGGAVWPQRVDDVSAARRMLVNFVYIPGGTFMMGSANGDSDERPAHRVTVSAFSMSRYEVTQAEYEAVMGKNPSSFKGANLPVEQVSWYDAVNYCNALSALAGLEAAYTVSGTDVIWNRDADGYRLPTEAEWEYAARGGARSRGFLYAGSGSADDVAWYYRTGGTLPAGTLASNELGLYDLSGNVAEWCWDWYGSYAKGAQTNPGGAASGTNRVFRGGNWYGVAYYCRVSYRSNSYPAYRSHGIGFRVALNAD